jgi:hypothetical protein
MKSENHTKFIITYSYNGEGYSDSDIEIVSVKNDWLNKPNTSEVKNYILEGLIGTPDLKTINIEDYKIEYHIDNDCDDAGCIYFNEFEGNELAVEIYPNICSMCIIRDEHTLQSTKRLIRAAMKEEGYDYQWNELEEEYDEVYGYCAAEIGAWESDLILRYIDHDICSVIGE